MDEKLVGMISQYCLLTWEVYVDGASNQKGSGVGLVLVSPKKVVIEKSEKSLIDFPPILWTIAIPSTRASYLG